MLRRRVELVSCKEPFEVRFRDHVERKIKVLKGNLERPDIKDTTRTKLLKYLKEMESLRGK
jgi:hypothetical protein